MSESDISRDNVVDLDALKNRVEAEKASLLKLGIRNGLVCPCGELVRDQGVTLFLLKYGELVRTDAGMLPGVSLVTITFHTRDCSLMQSAIDMKDHKPICVREFPRTEWLEEGIFEFADYGSGPQQHNMRNSIDRDSE